MIFTTILEASIEVSDYSYNYANIKRKTVLCRSIDRAIRKRLEECGRKVYDSVRVEIYFFSIHAHFSSVSIDGDDSQRVLHRLELKKPPSYVGRIPDPNRFLSNTPLYMDYTIPIEFSQESKS